MGLVPRKPRSQRQYDLSVRTKHPILGMCTATLGYFFELLEEAPDVAVGPVEERVHAHELRPGWAARRKTLLEKTRGFTCMNSAQVREGSRA